MNVEMAILGGAVAWLLSAALVAFIRHRAAALGLVQQANHRSSHKVPTPTGGGIGIAAGTIVGALIANVTEQEVLPAITIGVIIAGLGMVDDRWPLPAKLRLLVQIVGVAGFVIATGAPAAIVGSEVAAWTLPAAAVLVVVGIWWLNLFNFQDGIDGYAGSQALFMLIGSLLLASSNTSGTYDTSELGLTVAAICAVAAFLSFNWSPARIFMGDVGSTFLGFILFALAVLTHLSGSVTVWQWAILGVIFVADSTVTLIHRWIRGENIMQAHKSHAYQNLSRRWQSHSSVSLALTAANIAIVLPLAWVAGQSPGMTVLAICLAYLLAVTGALRLRAGQECS